MRVPTAVLFLSHDRAAATVSRSSQALYFAGIALSVPTLISLIHRQWALPVAPDISQFIAAYRALADGVAAVIHAPLRSFTVPPPPLIDLHILSFAGMGMMTPRAGGVRARRRTRGMAPSGA